MASETIDFPQKPGRDADAWIAEHIFGWTEVNVPPDYDGKNACVVLEPPGGKHPDLQWPNQGTVHRGFLCPHYSTEVRDAVQVAMEAGVDSIPLNYANSAWLICIAAFEMMSR